MPVPPPPPSATRFFKLPMIRPKPLQKRILEYLSQGGQPSINSIATDLGVWRFSARRSLRLMKRSGSVEDQWIWFAPSVVPGIKAHTFHMTDLGGRELRFLQSTTSLTEPIPLGWRILLCLLHGNPVTIGPIAKMLAEESGHARRVMKTLQNKGLVDCLYSKTRTSFGWDAITHLWKITECGRQVLDADPEAYLRIVRSHKQRTGRPSSIAAVIESSRPQTFLLSFSSSSRRRFSA